MSIMQYFNLDSAPLPLSWSPDWAFAGGIDGALYDVSRLDSLYSNTAGTIPIVGAGDPVGYVKDLSGNGYHAAAPSNAARPTLTRLPVTGRRNLLNASENIASSIWTKTGTINTADSIVANEANSQHRVDYSADCPVGAVWSGVVQSKGLRYFTFRFGSLLTVFDLVNGVVTLNNNSGAGISKAGDAWNVWVKNGVFSNIIRLNISANDGINSFVGNSIDGVYIYRQQLDAGEQTPYQKVTNAFDVTEAGVPDTWSLTFDGFDDVMTATSVPTLKLPIYTGAAVERNNYPDIINIFGARKDAANYSGLISSGSVAGTSVIGGLRSTLRGGSLARSNSGSSQLNIPDHFDSLSTIGTTDIRIKNSNTVIAPNTWLLGDQVTGAAINLFSTLLAGRFYRGVIINKAMSEVERGLINQWLKKGYSQ